ncbi:MAG: 2OG-Fe(II) oxygenase [Paracoccus sp. (in: a-proteobacteria)]|nr:2OG-Fe(II) oxygenase [Paracoccus sp. (in: a-proteobacteria)]
MTFEQIQPGDPAPKFRQATATTPEFAFDTLGGRYVLLCFFGSAADPQSRAALAAMAGLSDLFDDENACFFGVTVDPADPATGRVEPRIPGYRYFHDFDLAVSRLYGAAEQGASPPAGGEGLRMRRKWVLVDPMLRVREVVDFASDGSDITRITAIMRALPPPHRHAGFEVPAPILVLPHVFEPALCDHLVALYRADGGEESGFVRQVDGKTVGVNDRAHKSRRDHILQDSALINGLRSRFLRRVVPEIAKVHQFHVTRMERFIVSCYAADEGGHFRPHRDNTTSGTAHRRFAVSVNLNDDFEGGEVSFPEYGPRGYKAPKGGAVVFSCSLLHAVSRVTAGERFAFLPFLYDDAAAEIRKQNNKFLDESIGSYQG